MNSASKKCEASGKAPIEILPFATQNEALTRVSIGGADATISGVPVIGYAVKQSNGQLEAVLPTTSEFAGQGFNGIAAPKDDTELTKLVADTINELIAEGTYQSIFNRWGVAPILIGTAEVNPTVKD